MKKLRVLLNAFTILGMFGFSILAEASSGLVQLRERERLVLTEDHYGTFILDRYTRLDCNGHTIFNGNVGDVCMDDDGEYHACGVFFDAASGAQLKNCTIRNFDVGVQVLYTSNFWISENNINNNGVGIRLGYSSGGGSYVVNNIIERNVDEGINIDFVHGVRVNLNAINFNGRDGIDAADSDENYFVENWIDGNGLNGIELDGCNDNVLDTNRIFRNGFSGRRSGISLDNSDGNYLYENLSVDNRRDGIRIQSDSDNNAIEGNWAQGNQENDASESANSDNNVWIDNYFADQN